MTERGILFSAPMVRALLDGTKTQTRRALRVQPLDVLPMNGEHAGREWVGLMQREPEPKGTAFRCKFGHPGDCLWVRETFFAFGRWETRYSEKKQRDEWHFVDMTVECDRAYQHAASNPEVPLATGRGPLPGWYTRPAIHMPRVASRILLEIVSVRVERLQDISEGDAEAEGWPRRPEVSDDPQVHADAARDWYMDLWEDINGAGSWAANPWVWVVQFRRIER
jgi:hypothetical protein